MPKPKYLPWGVEKRYEIKHVRENAHYYSADAYATKLTNCGLKIEKDAYFRRERGETPVLADEIWYYAYVLGITPLEALVLYSRMPEKEEVFLSAKDALKHFEEAEKALEEKEKQSEETSSVV